MSDHESDHESQKQAQRRVVAMMREDRFCMVTTVGDQGRLHSHPMTPQETTDDGDVWFILDSNSSQASNVAAEKRVNVAFSDGSTWISVAGHATVRRDQAKLEELWNPVVEAWFPDGPGSEQVSLMLVESDSAEYWDGPGGRLASAIAFAKTKVTGGRPDVGRSGTVDL